MRRVFQAILLVLIVVPSVYWYLSTSADSNAITYTDGRCAKISWYKSAVGGQYGKRVWVAAYEGPINTQYYEWVNMTDADREQQLMLCGKEKPSE